MKKVLCAQSISTICISNKERFTLNLKFEVFDAMRCDVWVCFDFDCCRSGSEYLKGIMIIIMIINN